MKLKLSLWRLYILKSFPKTLEQNYIFFLQVKNELLIKEGIMMRNSGVFILQKFRKFVIDGLHLSYQGQGISPLKSLAHSYDGGQK